MKSDALKHQIREHFDADKELSAEAQAEIAACPELQVYYERLAALHEALLHMPLEEPSPGLTERVKASVAVERAQGPSPVSITLALFGALTAAVAWVGWAFQDWLDPARWWTRMAAWLPSGQWPESDADAAALVENALSFAVRVTRALDLSTLTLVLAAVGSVVFLVAFNGLEAFSLRAAAHGSRSSHSHVAHN